MLDLETEPWLGIGTRFKGDLTFDYKLSILMIKSRPGGQVLPVVTIKCCLSLVVPIGVFPIWAL